MKKSRTQLKKALQTFVNRMTKEEFAASLEKAGLEFYTVSYTHLTLPTILRV